MNSEEFRRHGYEVIDWIADYLDHADRFPVMSQSRPGDIKALIPDSKRASPWRPSSPISGVTSCPA